MAFLVFLFHCFFIGGFKRFKLSNGKVLIVNLGIVVVFFEGLSHAPQTLRETVQKEISI